MNSTPNKNIRSPQVRPWRPRSVNPLAHIVPQLADTNVGNTALGGVLASNRGSERAEIWGWSAIASQKPLPKFRPLPSALSPYLAICTISIASIKSGTGGVWRRRALTRLSSPRIVTWGPSRGMGSWFLVCACVSFQRRTTREGLAIARLPFRSTSAGLASRP